MKGSFRLAAPAVIDCEVLIIGSGAGGSSVADVVTKAGLSTVMLEEGPYVESTQISSMMTATLPRLWRGAGLTTTLGRTPISYAEGRCVGGGTEINSAIFQEAPDQLLDLWSKKYQIKEFNSALLSSYYKRAAQVVSASLVDNLGESSHVLRRGAEALSYQGAVLRRAIRSSDGPTDVIKTKQSMSATLIPKAMARGMRLIAECKAYKLVIKKQKIVKVIARARDASGNYQKLVIHPKLVFLCAGATQTPVLLLNNGLKHNVGQSLNLHPTIKCTAMFNYDLRASLEQVPGYAVTHFMPNQRMGGSVFTRALFGMSLADTWNTNNYLMKDWQKAGMYYAMIRAQGLGSIRPLFEAKEPIIRYSLIEDDWENLRSGLFHLAEIMFSAGAKLVLPSISGLDAWKSLDEAKKYLTKELPRNHTELMTIHLFSSCRPGENSKLCATDSFGKVYGTINLIVADASQIPEAPGVNPQATIMALATRNAEAALTQPL